MMRDQIIATLQERGEQLHQQYGVRRLLLFGSVARNQAGPASDIDLLVEFRESPSFDGYMDLKFALEDWLRASVDLVTLDALRPGLAEQIDREAMRVA
jgi:hypothetical protein